MNNIIAGIVTFNPNIERLKLNIDAIQNQVAIVVIVDNNSNNINEIISLIENNNITIIKNNENYGIAKALNQLVKYASFSDKSWLLTLDQDSICPINLISTFTKYLYKDIAILSPKIVDLNYLQKYYKQNDTTETDYVKEVITSGSLLNVDICIKLRGFDEVMFIDLVDFEYCIRVIKSNYKILRLNNTQLMHQLGDLRMYKLLGFSINVTNHSKMRQYYYARNNFYMYFKHKDYIQLRVVTKRLFKQFFKIVFFERDKILKIIYILKGVLDGIKLGVKI